MPLAILAVAGGLGLWSSHVQRQQQQDIQAVVASICNDILDGRDPAPRLASTDPLIRGRLVERLREVLGGPPPHLEIEISAGDTTGPGGPGDATHTAMLRVDGAEAMGLRIRHGGDGPGVAIIGFWTPVPPP
jgi:hypothetical protein